MSSRRFLFACACLGLLTFGIVFTTLGSVLPSIMARFGIDKAEAGSLFLLMSFGILAASLVFGPLVDRYGYKGILLAATVVVALGLEWIAFAPSLNKLRLAVLVTGFGGGIINGGTNALVADISGEERAAKLNLARDAHRSLLASGDACWRGSAPSDSGRVDGDGSFPRA